MTTTASWSVTERSLGLTTAQRLVADVTAGLRRQPPSLPPRWFYDDLGSRLFELITELPEYYPTRREEEILRAHAAELAALSPATTMVELGAGASTKTRLLLDAFTAEGRSLHFVPLDVSAEMLRSAARDIAASYPTVRVDALVADFVDGVAPLPGEAGRRLVVFLGGTIGNFDTDERAAFLTRLRDALAPGDAFLLGADLVKDPARLVAAYDDSVGVTAAFNRNVITVIARELEAAGLSGDDFDHVARWNAAQGRIEMWLRAARDIDVCFDRIGLRWRLARGEEMLTEISVKFTADQIRRELGAAGFELRHLWTDPAGDFSLSLASAR